MPDYPDRHLPTLFIYRKGVIVNQQVAWGVDKEKNLEGMHMAYSLEPVCTLTVCLD